MGTDAAHDPARRPRRTGHAAHEGRAWLAAAGGLLLAGTMLVSALLPPPPGEAPGKGPDEVEPGGSRTLIARYADRDGLGGLAAVTERETCDDGLDAAASYRPSAVPGETVRRIRERGYLTVGIDQNSYLWGYREPDTAEIVGFDLDLVEAIAVSLFGEATEETVRHLAIPTGERERAIQDGTVDMVVRTMSITCRRWEEVAFSTAYFETGQQLVVPRRSPVTGLDDSLRGRRVCSAEGSTAQTVLRRDDHGARLVSRPNHLDCLVLLQLGEADALMTDSALAAGHAAQDPGLRLVGEPLTEESYGVAMRQESVDLVRWVNQVLADYIAGGGWDAAYDRWLRPYLAERSAEPPVPLYRE